MPLPALSAALPAVIRKNPTIAVVGAGGAIGAVVLLRKKNAASSSGTTIAPAASRPAAVADTTATDLASAFQDMFNQLAGQVGSLQEQINNPNPGVTVGGGTQVGLDPRNDPNIGSVSVGGQTIQKAPASAGGPVNLGVLSSLQAQGYTDQGIQNLDAANKVGAAPPAPAAANGPGGPVNWALLSSLQAGGWNEAGVRQYAAAGGH